MSRDAAEAEWDDSLCRQFTVWKFKEKSPDM